MTNGQLLDLLLSADEKFHQLQGTPPCHPELRDILNQLKPKALPTIPSQPA